MEEGSYLYCIIGCKDARNFGPIGIGGGGEQVITLCHEDVSAVISRSPVKEYELTRENLLAHQSVIEEVMRCHTVLPVRFSTVAGGVEEIRGILRKRQREFGNLLKDMDNKVELGLKVLRKDMGTVFKEVAEADGEIRRLRDKVGAAQAGYSEKISLGMQVGCALEKRRQEEAERILFQLRPLSAEVRTNKLYGDGMVLNAAFLVDKAVAGEFDDRVKDLADSNGAMKFKYVGPVPPFNFVNIAIEWRC
ncbi:MAG: GvpL/GvpF family gas vesicle protein [Deltaproteobacteria bacterium]|nr:GvpL/GvpF family gas vesicle protein [Deltaproteobacteria bacterium]